MRRLVLSLVTSTVLCATTTAVMGAQTPASHSALRPTADTIKAGFYDLEITTDNGTMVGELAVRQEHGTLGAAIRAGAMTPAVKSLVRANQEYVLTVGHGAFVIIYTFTFHRDSVSGTMRGSGGLQGTVAGAYRR